MASSPLTEPHLPSPPRTAFPRLPQFRAEAVCWHAMRAPAEIAAWDALASLAAMPNPFLESWYLLPALEAFDPGGEVKLLRFEADGELAGILPLGRYPRYYRHPLPHWANWTHFNCFLGAPLVARGLEREFWQALLGWADRHAGAALFLHLVQQPLDGPLHAALVAELAASGRPAALVKREERALLASELDPEAYHEAAMSGKRRKELRRQHKRLSEEGELSFLRQEGTAGLEEWIDAFLWLEAAGWKGAAGSALAADKATTGLFREALRGAAARGRLERLTLTLDGAAIAMLANFITPPAAYSFKTAFDERYARFSPGVLIQRENLALLNNSEISWCDSCASEDHPMIDHFWRERRAIGRISLGIGGTARRALFRAIARAETRGRAGELA